MLIYCQNQIYIIAINAKTINIIQKHTKPHYYASTPKRTSNLVIILNPNKHKLYYYYLLVNSSTNDKSNFLLISP